MGCGGSTDNANAGGDGGDAVEYSDVDDENRFDLERKPVLSSEDGKGGEDADGFVFSTLKATSTPSWKSGSQNPPDPEPKNVADVPSETLDLEWAYGFRCDDGFNTIALDVAENVIYPTAGVVVSYDSKKHSQTFNLKHNDDITCLAQCPSNKNLIATGQVATLEVVRNTRTKQLPRVVVWDTKSNETVVIENANDRMTRCLGFSSDGKHLACVGYDDNVTINVFDANSGAKLASEGADQFPKRVNAVAWAPSKAMFVTAGVKHLKIWTLDGGLKSTSGKLSQADAGSESFYSVCWLSDDEFLVGAKSGKIYRWKADDGAAVANFKPHKRSVFSIVKTDTGLVTAGQDNKVHVFNGEEKQPSHSFTFDSYARSVAVNGKNMVVGLRKGEMKSCSDFTSASGQFTTIVESHWDGELWGLDTDPTDHSKFVTCGEENMLATWDLKTHKLVRKGTFAQGKKKKKKRRRGTRASTTSSHSPAECARAIQYSPDSKNVALGTNEGWLTVLDAKEFTKVAHENLNKVSRNKSAKTEQWIECLKYSPDGKSLAVGTHGFVIALVETAGHTVAGVLDKGHNASITHLDWSADGTKIHSNCMAYENLFHDISADLKDSKTNPYSAQFKDVDWHTYTCKIGWAVRGIWTSGMDGTDINGVDCSPDKSLFVVGDDWGRVCLYRNPVGDDNDKKCFDNGHSSFVIDTKFTKNGSHVISVGGGDKTILQWKLK